MEEHYIKADSANLPKVDSYMVAHFFGTNPDFCSAEFRNVKSAQSSRESYGDDAIGYVQLRREASLCTVKCKVCPEHKIRKPPYAVTMVIDEKESKVLTVRSHLVFQQNVTGKFCDHELACSVSPIYLQVCQTMTILRAPCLSPPQSPAEMKTFEIGLTFLTPRYVVYFRFNANVSNIFTPVICCTIIIKCLKIK